MFTRHTDFALAVPAELTRFDPDGTRTVTGPLGTVRYAADGTATWVHGDDLPPHAAWFRADLEPA